MIKTIFTTSLLVLGFINLSQAQVFATKAAKLRFFSETPIENIEAISNNTVGVLSTDKNTIQFSTLIKSFQFDKALMQEHFNENYMESESFPKATFSGTIAGITDWKKSGTYDVQVTGDLLVHGVSQKRTIPGKITIDDKGITIDSKFMVKCVDHKIDIPKIVMQKIAEEIEVSINATLQSFSK